jgi:hypothetical protein
MQRLLPNGEQAVLYVLSSRYKHASLTTVPGLLPRRPFLEAFPGVPRSTVGFTNREQPTT